MVLIVAATTLLSASSHAITPPPQTGTGSGSTTVRARCSSCRSSVEDRYREKLLLQIDSLRWNIENRRLTDAEKRRTVSELNSAIRALQQSLDEATRSAAVAAATGEAVGAGEAAIAPPVAIARIPMRARGYLGVTFDGPHTEIVRPGEHALRFYQYPKIALVEPSSPADRAGVLQGDTVMSFNGTDLIQNEINLTKLLVPESKVVMRVRRDGNAKDLKVTIGEAPDYYVRRRAAPVAVAGTFRVAPAPPQPEPGQPSVILWQEYEGVAGARVETISEGLGKAIGVSEGVLVMRVSPGTPAARAGLRDGDVIVRAAGQRIRTVPQLRGIIATGDREEGVTLLIRREKKEKDVTLRW